MNATMASAVFIPRSLIMMKKLAMQGTKRVMVTMDTMSCTGSRSPSPGEIVETGGAVVAAQEPDQEGLGGLRRQPQDAVDHRGGRPLDVPRR